MNINVNGCVQASEPKTASTSRRNVKVRETELFH